MKCRILKYNGDDQYSWAVFDSREVKGMKSPIMYGEAKPIVAGLSKREAESHKKDIERGCPG